MKVRFQKTENAGAVQKTGKVAGAAAGAAVAAVQKQPLGASAGAVPTKQDG